MKAGEKRFEPYTVAGIARVECSRLGCDRPAHANWNICADKVGNRTRYRPICVECDIDLNRLAMRFMFGDTREDDLDRYAEKARREADE